ncbi:hypothetical protein NEMBOFW57_008515 [Staphylotrichum longicolle]|uniref:non-specific serine/threonine protein kinase n=1 Tax=Staphylotrichum longicolle TaxID=669026 RepID=A0AAD4ERY7_9PEZI|nr:hypothetical protein NEMBOFW57_008515 [Staphylotrichum longicolle]
MVNPLDYNIGVPAEDLGNYCPGGYHPILLNDRLHDGRYEIVHKLGFGSFSTIWLARDHREQRNVTIKVVVASKSDETARELDILSALKEQGDPAHPGRKHVSHLIESFHHEGPNGRHLCIVLGMLGPKLSSVVEDCPEYRLDGTLARSVSRQLLLAVVYLHSVGVAHGDIHMGNVLLSLPDFEEASLEAIFEDLGPPQIGKVERYDGMPLEPGIPEYLVEPAEYGVEVDEETCEIQLIDFGESFFIADPPKLISTPMPLRPPELVFQRPLTNAAHFDEDQGLIPQFEKVLGGLPQQWIEEAIQAGVFKERPDDSSKEFFRPLEEEIRRSYFDDRNTESLDLTQADLDVLGRYLRRLLVVDPVLRAAARDLLDDPWVLAEEK